MTTEPNEKDVGGLRRMSRRQALQRAGGALAASLIAPKVMAHRADIQPKKVIRSGAVALRSRGLPRCNQTITLLDKGAVLVVGGDNIVPLKSAEIYYPPMNKWWDAASMNTPRTIHAAALLRDGRVLVMGGALYEPDGTPIALDSAEVYDPREDSWTTVTSMNTHRYGHSATALPNGTVLVTGGCYKGYPVNTPEIYDPRSDTWTTVESS
jgi:hypothetical protein